jgi:hypothetical protein
MPTELRKAFIEYTERVSSLSQRVAILPGKERDLGDLVKDIEGGSEFHTLVQATRDEFGNTELAPDGDMTSISMIQATHYESDWRHAVGNVLRRSGFYMNIFEEKLNDPSEEFERYMQVFKRPERKISYLALLEYVSFEQNNIDCGHFQIKRFSRDELDAVLGNSINEIFYPWAVVDLDQITDYWFIYIEETVSATEIGYINLDFDLSDDDRYCVKMRYTPRPFPALLESIIKLLALFDWPTSYGWGEAVESATGWNRFNIPFVLTVTDSLYESPSLPSRFERLWKEPIFDGMTGEESREKYPVILISLNEQETESLIEFVKRTHENLQKLDFEKSWWHFFEIALNMFVKAFFADGLEQLLWHITAIEALLGENGPDLTAKLARRIAAICGKTEEKDSLRDRKKFKKLYTFRSNLIHGNRFKKNEVDSRHLREARDFARRALVWFLEFLVMIQNGILQSQIKYPKRNLLLKLLDLVWFLEFLAIIQDGILQNKSEVKCPKRNLLLKLLDMDETELDIEKTERSHLKALLQILPPEFPHLE